MHALSLAAVLPLAMHIWESSCCLSVIMHTSVSDGML